MLLGSLIKCAILISLTQLKCTQCNSNATNNASSSNGKLIGPSFISVRRENVTPRDKFVHSSSKDKGRKDQEPPQPARSSKVDSYQKKLDAAYRKNYDYDYGFSPALGSSELPECILSSSEFYLSWWVNEDGTLRIPASDRSGESVGFADLSMKFQTDDMIFKHVASLQTNNPNDVITFMSVANNALKRLPVEALNLVNVSLQYLSLANNNFEELFAYHDKSFQKWSAFPLMKNLKELDLRNCSLKTLDYDLFDNLPKLEKLFLSHNSLSTISQKTFSKLPFLRHLDLSYNMDMEELALGYSNSDVFSFYLSGLMLEEDAFLKLTALTFLDLSHSKLKQESVKALASLRIKVEQLSLCYTEIPFLLPFMFYNTNLKVIDLSGNPGLVANLNNNWFAGLEGKLEILVFKASNLKNLAPLRYLRKLRMLDLEDNNINQIVSTQFVNFVDLEILDLNMNHISNWYQRVFLNHTKLKIVNLRLNNINLMTSEMMRDFNEIKFLAIGGNNFVCDCSLREFIERATYNAMRYNCGSKRKKRSYFIEDYCDPKYHYDVFLREYQSYIRHIEESYKNIIGDQTIENRIFNILPNVNPVNCAGTESTSLMTFDFLLLDYSENDYHCIESNGSSKTKVFFIEVASCKAEPIYDDRTTTVRNTTPDVELEEQEEVEHYEKLDTPRTLLFIYVGIGLPLTFITALWIWKRKDIRYFFSILKNTLILSFEKGDNNSLLANQRRKSGSSIDNYRFDLFVSYSEKDRDFVLDQLIPNLEKRSEITICLHERDFQVGLSILENIIQCMDQSRCLLLVVSESFLKSNWCSFEMHLAQHRLIETRREQLILVLLQDIPKARRPRTLSFLMRTKTYIMWPSEDKEELRNVFWKRLKKAVILNNWEPENVRAKPRHSIV